MSTHRNSGGPAGDDDETEESPSERRICVDCGITAPPSASLHTLISSKYGWRLERSKNADGSYRFDWRCPKCWLAWRRKAAPP